jgi:hypothetical protein
MKVRCIKNKGADLRPYEYESLEKEMMGRFGATGFTDYGELDVGKEYLVMGLIIFKTYQAYLVDDSGFISACPCQLFEILDDRLGSNWHFRIIDKEEGIYPFVQAVFGYAEFCSNKKAYENLIVEMEENAQQIYFKRKIELENELME